MAYAKEVYEALENAGIRAEIDDRNEKISYKIREASKIKIPYIVIVGDKERDEKTLSLRLRGNVSKNDVKLEDLIKEIQDKTKNHTLD